MFVCVCFYDWFCRLTWQTGWYICEKTWQRVDIYVRKLKDLETCICLWPEFDCPEVTLCGWQDIKIQLLLLLLPVWCVCMSTHLLSLALCIICKCLSVCSVCCVSFTPKNIFFQTKPQSQDSNRYKLLFHVREWSTEVCWRQVYIIRPVLWQQRPRCE